MRVSAHYPIPTWFVVPFSDVKPPRRRRPAEPTGTRCLPLARAPAPRLPENRNHLIDLDCAPVRSSFVRLCVSGGRFVSSGQYGGSANCGVQTMIVGDGVEFRDDRADQAPRQLRLISNLLGSGTATKQQ